MSPWCRELQGSQDCWPRDECWVDSSHCSSSLLDWWLCLEVASGYHPWTVVSWKVWIKVVNTSTLFMRVSNYCSPIMIVGGIASFSNGSSFLWDAGHPLLVETFWTLPFTILYFLELSFPRKEQSSPSWCANYWCWIPANRTEWLDCWFASWSSCKTNSMIRFFSVGDTLMPKSVRIQALEWKAQRERGGMKGVRAWVVLWELATDWLWLA